MKFEFKKDRYSKARGGYSRFLDISCADCGAHLCFYQKDGPGILKRMYLDRITEPLAAPGLFCQSCGEKIGNKYVYEKENRDAYILNQGTFAKKIVRVGGSK